MANGPACGDVHLVLAQVTAALCTMAAGARSSEGRVHPSMPHGVAAALRRGGCQWLDLPTLRTFASCRRGTLAEGGSGERLAPSSIVGSHVAHWAWLYPVIRNL